MVMLNFVEGDFTPYWKVSWFCSFFFQIRCSVFILLWTYLSTEMLRLRSRNYPSRTIGIDNHLSLVKITVSNLDAFYMTPGTIFKFKFHTYHKTDFRKDEFIRSNWIFPQHANNEKCQAGKYCSTKNILAGKKLFSPVLAKNLEIKWNVIILQAALFIMTKTFIIQSNCHKGASL